MGQFLRNNSFNLLLLIIIGISLVVYYVVVAPSLLQLPSTYTFQADLLAEDNIYQESNQGFTGAMLNASRFQLNTERQDGQLLLKSNFEVKTQQGTSIVTLDRSFPINQYSRELTTDFPANNPVYTIFPRWVEKMEYTYLHPSYMEPFTMTYLESVTVGGLELYHFVGTQVLEDVKEDDVMPGVPDTHDVFVTATLDLFIEPVSGHIAYFQDNAIGSYIDKETGQEIERWKSYSNHFHIATIASKTSSLLMKKILVIFVERTMPAILIALMVSILPSLMLAQSKLKTRLTITSTIVSLLLITGLSLAPFISFAQSNQLTTVIVNNTNPSESSDITIQIFKDSVRESLITNPNIKFIDINVNPTTDIQDQLNSIKSEQHIDLIFTIGTANTLRVSQQDSTTPILFSYVVYPVKSGLIHSFNHSKNNLVGVSYAVPSTEFIQAISDILPNSQSVIIVRQSNQSNSEFQATELLEEARFSRINLIDLPVANTQDLNTQLSGLDPTQVDAFFIACDNFMALGGGLEQVLSYANQHQKPVFGCPSTTTSQGGVLHISHDPAEIGRIASQKAVTLLSGVSPSAIETTAPTSFDMYLNLTAAEKLNLTIPPHIPDQAVLVSGNTDEN